MEEICTCKGCGSQNSWVIFRDRLECSECNRKVMFSEDVKAMSLIRLTNDNF